MFGIFGAFPVVGSRKKYFLNFSKIFGKIAMSGVVGSERKIITKRVEKPLANEWYIRDCSRKVTAVLRAKGMSGKHTTNHAIYGYRKDPDDPGHWLIDEEAAAVVRRIFQLTIEGSGPHQIARILTEEKVERPAYYLGQRNQGTCQSRDYSDERFIWQGTTVSEMLTRPEYMGHTVNFRTYKDSYKDKRPKKAAKEDWVIFLL